MEYKFLQLCHSHLVGVPLSSIVRFVLLCECTGCRFSDGVVTDASGELVTDVSRRNSPIPKRMKSTKRKQTRSARPSKVLPGTGYRLTVSKGRLRAAVYHRYNILHLGANTTPYAKRAAEGWPDDGKWSR